MTTHRLRVNAYRAAEQHGLQRNAEGPLREVWHAPSPGMGIGSRP